MSATIQIAPKKSSHSLRFQAEKLVEQEFGYIYSRDFEQIDEDSLLHNAEIELFAPDSNTANSSGELSQLMSGKLLTAEGEEYLFTRMNYCWHRANKLRAQLDPPHADSAQLSQIYKYIEVAKESRSLIIESNTRLVAAIAHKFSNSRLDYEELISEGNMILVNCVDKFNVSKGFRFSTYATHAVQRHFYRLIQKSQKRKNREAATSSEILSEAIPVEEKDQPLDHTIAEALMSKFNECLDDREAVIIRERFGLNREESAETLQTVADKVGLSKERVRQLQMQAIEKLQDLAIKLNLTLEPSI